MKIGKATAAYERWLGRRLTLIKRDIELKHQHMKEALFPFLRATYYRWAQAWPEVSPGTAAAPAVLAVGDLHVENFGTWRDIEGRLIWGINDFDEAWRLPYTNDLVRLATSAHLAIAEQHLSLQAQEACDAIAEGYAEALGNAGRPGGRAFVLAEHHSVLRKMAVERLHNPESYWEKLKSLPTLEEKIPAGARRAMERMMPERGLEMRIVHRIAGLGSLGRQRFLALAEWRGGTVAREAKALAPSACVWAAKGGGSAKILYQEIVDRAVRAPDPFVRLKKRWIVRRLAPDCSRIELAALPKERDEIRLLHAMGFETANVHLGSGEPRAIRADLKKRGRRWLHRAAQEMAEAVERDWKDWRKASGA
ncbi:MAG TPA: DUF2252 family protein [Bryobacterales bacterium]|nr:DUF2252 family protein [Bryobacterales bacterium]